MRRTIAIMTAMILGTFLVNASPQNSDGDSLLYVVRVDGKYGFIDRSGKIVITPQYEEASGFHEGLSMVRVRGKYGFIDQKGGIAVKPLFDDWLPFSEGLAAVKVGRKWGYVGASGQVVIQPQFDFTLGFSEGLARVELGKKSGYIDKSGKIVFQIDGFASGFSEQLAAVNSLSMKNQKAFFIDHSGKQAFQGEFSMVGDFGDGMAAVERDEKWGYIDRTGNVVIPFQRWSPWGKFSEGLAVVFVPKGVKYIDKAGKDAITGKFVRAEPFSEGLAAVQLKVGDDTASRTDTPAGTVLMFKAGVKYGYIDKTGAMVIPPQFEKAGKFTGGLAQVCLESTLAFDPSGRQQPCGYIDTTGKMIWQPSK